jgi:hypothetical protein
MLETLRVQIHLFTRARQIRIFLRDQNNKGCFQNVDFVVFNLTIVLSSRIK